MKRKFHRGLPLQPERYMWLGILEYHRHFVYSYIYIYIYIYVCVCVCVWYMEDEVRILVIILIFVNTKTAFFEQKIKMEARILTSYGPRIAKFFFDGDESWYKS